MSSAHRDTAWLREVVRANRVPAQWDRVLLAAIGIATPVGLAVAVAPQDGRIIGAGSLASIGALAATVLDVGDVGIERVRRMLFVSITAAFGFTLGTIVYSHAVATFVAVAAAALISGLSGTLGMIASKCALYFLVFAVTAANVSFGLSEPWAAPMIFLGGALWRLLLTAVWVGIAGTALAPERAAVAGVYAAIADQLATSGTPEQTGAARQLTRALDHADDVMTAARTAVAVRDGRWHALIRLLDATAPAIDATIAMEAAGEQADPGCVAFFRDIARWIASASRGAPHLPSAGSSTPAGTALASSMIRIDQVLEQITHAPRGRRMDPADLPLEKASRLSTWQAVRAAVTGGRASWGSALRLALCMALAQAVALAWDLDRPYLVMVTVAQVMKPDFGSVIARALQRGGGTIVGVAVGCLVIVLVPTGGWQILVIALLAGVVPLAMARNYGLYSVVTTPLAVILVEVRTGAEPSLIESRMADTVLGCVIVIVIGYLPWPATWHVSRHIRADVGTLAQSVLLYLDGALPGASARSSSSTLPEPDPVGARAATAVVHDVDQLRRQTYRQISDVRTAVARSLAEPPPVSTAAASWLSSIAALERVADEVTALATTASPADLSSSGLAEVRTALGSLGAALATDAVTDPVRLPTSGPRGRRAGAVAAPAMTRHGPLSAPRAAFGNHHRAVRSGVGSRRSIDETTFQTPQFAHREAGCLEVLP